MHYFAYWGLFFVCLYWISLLGWIKLLYCFITHSSSFSDESSHLFLVSSAAFFHCQISFKCSVLRVAAPSDPNAVLHRCVRTLRIRQSVLCSSCYLRGASVDSSQQTVVGFKPADTHLIWTAARSDGATRTLSENRTVSVHTSPEWSFLKIH